MSISIDTNAVRRLRDMLLEEGRFPGQPAQLRSSAHRQAAMERVIPFAETMYLVMMADGHLATSEAESVKGAIRVLTQGVLDESALEDLLARCNRNVRSRGADTMLQILGGQLSANRTDRETAFTLAAAVALADNSVADTELQLVVDIAEWYGISTRRAQELLGQLQRSP